MKRSSILFYLISISAVSYANVLMVDWGGAGLDAAAEINSPYHTVNGSFSDTEWNSGGKSSDNTLNWSDGTSATGVAYTTFKGNAGATSVAPAGWSSNSSDINGSIVNTGVYAGSSVGRDGYMMTSGFTDNRSIGVQFTGLAAGTYDIYLTGRNTNYISAEYTQNFYAAAASATGSFDFAGYDSESTTFAANATDKVGAWTFVSGDSSASNYAKFTVTLDSGNPYLNIGTIGDSTNGVFSSVQIVAVPEPSSLVLIGLTAVGMGLGLRRRSR